MAIVWVFARLHLVYQVAYGKCVNLGSAKNKCLFILVDLLHEQLHSVCFALLDFDDLVKVSFGITFAGFNLTFDQLVVGSIDIFVEGLRDLLYLERRQKPSLMPSLSE